MALAGIAGVSIVTPKMLSTAEAALMLGLSPYTLRLWRHQGKGPRFVKLGNAKQANAVYFEDEVRAFVAARTFASTSAVTVSHPDNA